MGPPEPPFGEHQPTIPPPGNGSRRWGQEWGPKNGARKQVQKMGPPEPLFGEHQPTILKTSSRIWVQKTGPENGSTKIGPLGRERLSLGESLSENGFIVDEITPSPLVRFRFKPPLTQTFLVFVFLLLPEFHL